MTDFPAGRRRFARIDRLPPYVFNVTAELKLAARRRGEDVIDLSMGNPDGAAIDPETEVVVTIGSKEGLAHLMLATLGRGDTVLVPDPSYPIHMYGAVIAGADIRSVPIAPDIDFFAELERAIRGSDPKPKLIVVVHDLAYADIVFNGWKAPSIMQIPGAKDVAVEFFTLSKSYNMAGWRVGFMVGNRELVNALARIKSYHDYGIFTPLQVAAIAALEGDQQCVRDIAAKYQD